MKLWLIRPVDDDSPPWHPWYDKYFGFVVRAETEDAARAVVASRKSRSSEYDEWVDPKWSTCIELTADGPPEVVIADFHAA